MPRRPLVVAATLSLLLLIAHLGFHTPALSDPTGAALPEGVWLAFPTLNIILAPLFDLWDGVTLLTLPQLNAFLLGALTLGAAWSIGTSIRDGRLRWGRATARLAFFVVGLAFFVLGGVAWRRPMAHIAGVPDSLIVVDLHSHTNVSHDVKGWLQGDFDLEASRRWHARGGFDAFFVTDHNRIDGWKGKTLEGNPTACPGEELSLWGAHIVVLLNEDSIPRGMYADSAPGIHRLFGDAQGRWHGFTLASLPEYNENHFADLPRWMQWGVSGFEVSNAAPKANRQRLVDRDSVIRLATTRYRAESPNTFWPGFLAGVTDQHGMGATVQAWTLLVPSAKNSYDYGDSFSAPDLCYRMRLPLYRGQTRVVERHRLRIDSAWPVFATVIGVPWEGWRAAGMRQVVSWLAWIWGIALIAGVRSKKALS